MTTAAVSTAAPASAAADRSRRSKSRAASRGMRQTAETLLVITARPRQIPAHTVLPWPSSRTPSRISQSSNGSSMWPNPTRATQSGGARRKTAAMRSRRVSRPCPSPLAAAPRARRPLPASMASTASRAMSSEKTANTPTVRASRSRMPSCHPRALMTATTTPSGSRLTGPLALGYGPARSV